MKKQLNRDDIVRITKSNGNQFAVDIMPYHLKPLRKMLRKMVNEGLLDFDMRTKTQLFYKIKEVSK